LSISQLFFRSPIFIWAHDFTGVGIQALFPSLKYFINFFSFFIFMSWFA
jgi:hypothetical protein